MPPDELPPAAGPDAGPVDPPSALAAPVVALGFGALALLGVFVFWGIGRSRSALPWLAVPGAPFLLAAVLALRA